MLKSMQTLKKSLNEIDYVIFSAMPEELNHFENYFEKNQKQTKKIGDFEFPLFTYNGKRILLASTGLGTSFASTVITLVCNRFTPSHIFFSGTAGGIHSDLNICDVVIAEKAFEAEIQNAFTVLKGTPFESCLKHPLKKDFFPSHYPADSKLLDIANNAKLAQGKIYKGTIVSSNAFPAPKELFENIKSLNPYSIDMETSAFYQTAWLLQIPALAIRGISNLINSNGTDENVSKSDINGSTKAACIVLLQIIDSLTLELNKKIKEETNCRHDEAKLLIKKLGLQPHPEGGNYARFFQSTSTVQSSDDRYQHEPRVSGTSIYYLLEKNDFSAWHRLKSDEIWHYYKGNPVNIYLIDQQGELKTYILGDSTIYDNALFQVGIPAGNWFSAEIIEKDSYSLVGCTVSPGFDFKDFELACRDKLIKEFPTHAEIITKLTRLVSDSQPTFTSTKPSPSFM